MPNTLPANLPNGLITLLPRFVERIWGTDALAPYFPAPEIEPGKKIGEVWLTAEECQVEGSTFTLRELAARDPSLSADGNGFPLLIKLLFPREKLSVQVHPDDAYAQAKLGQPRGKTECWYVLSADPGAQVAIGFREPISPDAIRAAIGDGSIESKMRRLPVHAGDMIFIDAGTVHAIGPGMVVLETQQYSDVTYRLWDYGRPRELHVSEGLAVTNPGTAAGLVQPTSMGAFDRLLTCPYFTVDRFRLQPATAAELGDTGQLQILVALGTAAMLRSEAGTQPLPRAHAVLLPAGGPAYSLFSEAVSEVIRITAAPKAN